MQKKTINIPIYNFKLQMVLFSDCEEVKSKFKLKDSISNFDAFVISGDDKITVFFEDSNYICPGVIAHEAKHIVNIIFSEIHQELDLYNDEAECYLLGYIVKEIHKFLNNE